MDKRHDDNVIQRRFAEHASTHTTRQVYAVTYPGHSDRGTEQEGYAEAERVALEIAEAKGFSVWYEETPQSARRTLVRSFRPPPPDPTGADPKEGAPVPESA